MQNDELNLPKAIMQMLGNEMDITLSIDIIENISDVLLKKLKKYDKTINFTGIKAVDSIDDLTGDDYYTHRVYGNTEMYEVVDDSVINVKTDNTIAIIPVVFEKNKVSVHKLTELGDLPKRRVFVKSNFNAEKEINDIYPDENEQLKFLNAVTAELLETGGTACMFKLMIRTESNITQKKFLGFNTGKKYTVVDKQAYVGAVLVQSIERQDKDHEKLDNIDGVLGKLMNIVNDSKGGIGVKVINASPENMDNVMNDDSVPDFIKKEILNKMGKEPIKPSNPKQILTPHAKKKKDLLEHISQGVDYLIDENGINRGDLDNSVKEIKGLLANANILDNLSEFSVIFSNKANYAGYVKDFNLGSVVRFSSLLEVYKNDKLISMFPKKVDDVLENDSHLIGFLNAKGNHRAFAVIIDSSVSEKDANDIEYRITWCVIAPTITYKCIGTRDFDIVRR